MKHALHRALMIAGLTAMIAAVSALAGCGARQPETSGSAATPAATPQRQRPAASGSQAAQPKASLQ